MINRFEATGIFVSVAFMALALFLLNFETATQELTANGVDSAASAVVADENIASTLYNSVDSDGELNKLVIDNVVVGAGETVSDGDKISVHYIGTLANGQEFDNSYLRGEPFTFTIGKGEVIAGWDQGLLGMKPGGQRILVIPAELAYGDAKVGPIPANSTLVFAVELISVNE